MKANPLKIFAGVVAVILMIGYLAPVVVKLRDPALTIVVLIGVVMMIVDLWQSLQAKDD
jgi:hypothetical protein